jgi:hypothetical protein
VNALTPGVDLGDDRRQLLCREQGPTRRRQTDDPVRSRTFSGVISLAATPVMRPLPRTAPMRDQIVKPAFQGRMGFGVMTATTAIPIIRVIGHGDEAAPFQGPQLTVGICHIGPGSVFWYEGMNRPPGRAHLKDVFKGRNGEQHVMLCDPDPSAHNNLSLCLVGHMLKCDMLD